jgi:hypothetical protein
MAAKLEVCQILLSSGANPNLEQNNGMYVTYPPLLQERNDD